jgi:predicted metalloendopeptidase
MNARMVAAFVSIMDSTISFPAASLTATEMLA